MTRHIGRNGIQRGGGISRNTQAIAPTTALVPTTPLLSGIKPTWDKERAKRIARNVAIGLASAATIGGIAYGAHSIYSNYNIPRNIPLTFEQMRPIVAVSSRDIPEDVGENPYYSLGDRFESSDDEKQDFEQISAEDLIRNYEIPHGSAEDPYGGVTYENPIDPSLVFELLKRYFTRGGRREVVTEFYLNGPMVLELMLDIIESQDFIQNAHKRQYTDRDLEDFRDEISKVIIDIEINRPQ